VAIGSFVLALHGHMPWVLHHGRWPHGEAWLFEAALGVYLPLLRMVDRLAARGVDARLTLGLTPVLLEQLRHPTFRAGMSAFLDDRLRRATADAADPELRARAAHWAHELEDLRARFHAVGGDLVGPFGDHARAGRVELLSGFATHGYAPLIKHDACIHAQLEAGLRTSERHLGFRPGAIWLPECAFQPAGPWTVPVLGGERRVAEGVDRILEAHGVRAFFVDAHLLAGARSEGLVEGGVFRKVPWTDADRYPGRGWRSVLEPHRVGSHGEMSEVTAFARHPDVSEQVWSADVGYPGDPRYLEFHKRKDGDGLRYWRVTDRKAGLGAKAPYDPAAVGPAVFAHARHFATTVRDRLRAWTAATGRDGCLTATFDAELFGHWWHEGPAFLEEVLLALHADPDVRVQTPSERLQTHPPDKVAWLPEGSWGEGGDHRVWLNDTTRWTWEAQLRAEDRFMGLRWRLQQTPRRLARRAEPVLKEAARELLLLQASDWQFVIHSGGAIDYGFRRYAVHLDRFDVLCGIVDDLCNGITRPDAVQDAARRLAARADDCFPDLELSDWRDG
jgi:1,4-alpha-glucan branching enzyme